MSWRRGQTYSQDLRGRGLTAQGSARAVASQFSVSVSYVVKARQRLARTGAASPRPQKPPVIPNPTDQNRCTRSRIPMDMMRHGISISRFQ